MALAPVLSTNAQDTKALYQQAKSLYDADNYDQAVPLLRKAAEKGHKKAQYRLGRCYEKGHGVAVNETTAVQWYQKSAKQGYDKAQYRLGMCYKEGKGVTKNRQKANEYFAKAAQQENADAQYQLAKAYLKGKGVPPNEKKARTLLKKAVSNPKDGADILKKIKKDAAEGDEAAQRMLTLVK